MTRTTQSLFSVMLLLAPQPAFAGEVAVESLTIQHEGMAKSAHDGRYILTTPKHVYSDNKAKAGKAGTGDPDRPVIVGSPPNPRDRKITSQGAKESSPAPAKGLSGSAQEGDVKFIPEKDDQVLMGFESGQIRNRETKQGTAPTKGSPVRRYHLEQAWPSKVN